VAVSNFHGRDWRRGMVADFFNKGWWLIDSWEEGKKQ